MNSQELQEKISALLPEATYEENPQFLTVIVPNEQSYDFFQKLRNDKDLLFDYLFCLTGVDWGKELGVVYHLKSIDLQHSLVVKINLEDRENPNIDTISDIWKTADFHEREVFDLFGIKFNNHPDLRRIFLEDDWVGFPLRKDYKDPVNIVAF